jgi:hypothetical protein
VSPTTTHHTLLCRALEDAGKRFRDYRSDCVFFAATFARGLTDYLGGPRDLVSFERPPGLPGDGPVEVQEAIRLDEDTYWHLVVRIHLAAEKAHDVVRLEIRFKKMEGRYVVNLFGHEDFELAEPSSGALEPVFDELFFSLKRHYEDGLRLFLDARGQNLHLPFTAARQVEIAGR